MTCDIQDDIEIAARDSALLAEELADMLDRLENGDGYEDDEDDGETESVVASELEEALKLTERLSQESVRLKKKKEKKLRRKPKQKEDDFDLGFVGKLLDVLNLDQAVEDEDIEDEVFSEDFEQSGKRGKVAKLTRKDKSEEEEGDRSSKSGYSAPEKSEEKCETTVATDQVNVCVPDYETKPQSLYFRGQETYDEKYCYVK